MQIDFSKLAEVTNDRYCHSITIPTGILQLTVVVVAVNLISALKRLSIGYFQKM